VDEIGVVEHPDRAVGGFGQEVLLVEEIGEDRAGRERDRPAAMGSFDMPSAVPSASGTVRRYRSSTPAS
jgi:hypothetical protein